MIRTLAFSLTLPAAAIAEVPRVVTDVAPIHSLTAQVMGDLGTPDLLLSPGADPHDFALRPSDAQTLNEANLVIWVGEALTSWMEEPLTTLAPDATKISLMETEGWNALAFRDLAEIGGDDDHDHDDAHNHEEAEHDHDDDHDKDEHGHDDHGHDHGSVDPHGWADPAVAKVWVANIAEALSVVDPDNAATYQANAAATAARLDELDAALATKISPFADRNYVLPHDGYQYFEARYGLSAIGALATGNAETPGPARVAALREQMTEEGIVCVFSDTSIPERWADIVTEGTDAATASIDIVGLGLEPGAALYAQMMTRLGDSFAACLAG